MVSGPMIIAILFLGLIVFYIIHLAHSAHKKRALISQVTQLDRGDHAERSLVYALLRMGFPPEKIFHDLYVELPGKRYSQIDLAVVTEIGLLVFEVKDYSGWIFGTGNRAQWTQVLAYGRQKIKFYNPLLQNEGHIRALKQVCPELRRYPIFSIVIFYGDCELKEINLLPPLTYVVKAHHGFELLDYLFKHHEAVEYQDEGQISETLRKAAINGASSEVRAFHSKYVSMNRQDAKSD